MLCDANDGRVVHDACVVPPQQCGATVDLRIGEGFCQPNEGDLRLEDRVDTGFRNNVNAYVWASCVGAAGAATGWRIDMEVFGGGAGPINLANKGLNQHQGCGLKLIEWHASLFCSPNTSGDLVALRTDASTRISATSWCLDSVTGAEGPHNIGYTANIYAVDYHPDCPDNQRGIFGHRGAGGNPVDTIWCLPIGIYRLGSARGRTLRGVFTGEVQRGFVDEAPEWTMRAHNPRTIFDWPQIETVIASGDFSARFRCDKTTFGGRVASIAIPDDPLWDTVLVDVNWRPQSGHASGAQQWIRCDSLTLI